MICIVSVLFGVVFLGATYAGGFVSGILMPFGLSQLGYEPFYGIYFMAASFGVYVMRKPGTGLISETIAAVLESLRTFESRHDQDPLRMATVVSVRCGSRNFGIQAGDGEICLTIRSETDDGLQTLQDTICGAASKAAERERLKLEISYQDVFPDTYNDPYTTDFFYRNLERIHLPVFTLQEPMRWSEDFGWYLKEREGLYFGIGSGPETPGLHTPSYMFPETLADKGGKTWLRMIMTASKYLESFK